MADYPDYIIDDANYYQDRSCRTIDWEHSQSDLVLGFTLGLNGEAGEVAEQIKKMYFHGHDFDREQLVLEMGDVLWYLSAIASVFDIRLSEVMTENVRKLERRYPSGFSHERSRNRVD